MVSSILQALYIYYVSCWFPKRDHFYLLERILHSFLCKKYNLMQKMILMTQHASKVKGHFELCDIIFTPQDFQVASSPFFKSIWSAQRQVTRLVQVVNQGGIWTIGQLGVERWKELLFIIFLSSKKGGLVKENSPLKGFMEF